MPKPTFNYTEHDDIVPRHSSIDDDTLARLRSMNGRMIQYSFPTIDEDGVGIEHGEAIVIVNV